MLGIIEFDARALRNNRMTIVWCRRWRVRWTEIWEFPVASHSEIARI